MVSPTGKSPVKRRLIQAYPDLPLRARLTAFVHSSAMSNAEATLAAISAVHDQLGSRWAPTSKAPSQLFTRSAYHRPPSVEVQQTGIRLDIDDIATIDDLAAHAGAPSRSAYVCAAWDLFLPALPPPERGDDSDAGAASVHDAAEASVQIAHNQTD